MLPLFLVHIHEVSLAPTEEVECGIRQYHPLQQACSFSSPGPCPFKATGIIHTAIHTTIFAAAAATAAAVVAAVVAAVILVVVQHRPQVERCVDILGVQQLGGSEWEAVGGNGRQWEAMGGSGRQWEAVVYKWEAVNRFPGTIKVHSISNACMYACCNTSLYAVLDIRYSLIRPGWITTLPGLPHTPVLPRPLSPAFSKA